MGSNNLEPMTQAPSPTETLSYIRAMLDNLRVLADDAGASFLHYLASMAFVEASETLMRAPPISSPAIDNPKLTSKRMSRFRRG